MRLPIHSFLLHHDPDAAAGATGIRYWLGQDWVHQISVTLHTTGALLVAAALMAVLYLRAVHGSNPAQSGWTVDTRRRLRTMVFWGWGLNFAGGIMRLYEPDHPGLSAAPEVAWVNLLIVKHLALLGAIVFSLFAVELAPGTWRERHRASATVALLLVLFASLAGGISTGLPLPDVGVNGDEAASTTAGDPFAFQEPVVLYRNSSVQMTGNMLMPANVEVPLEVPDNVSEVVITISWQNDISEVTAELIDEQDEVIAESGGVDETSAEMSVAGSVAEGPYTIRLHSTQAVQETVQVVAKITQGFGAFRVLEETVTVAGLGFEVNMYVDDGDWFTYEWSVSSADGAIPWDIHSHPDGEVVIHEEGTDRSAEGNFTAGDHEIYSIFWRPEAGQVATLTYRLEGPFRVHSIFRGS